MSNFSSPPAKPGDYQWIYGLRLYLAIVPIVLLYFVMRFLTKRDQWFIDIVLENISQKDVLLP
jgi:type IV secretory pathway VirB3-like protein